MIFPNVQKTYWILKKKNSAVGQLEKLVQNANERFEKMFDPNSKGSYASRLNDQLSGLVGADGTGGTLGALMRESLQPVLKDLQEVKEKIESQEPPSRSLRFRH